MPPRVEYALTALGKSLIPPALALAGWADEHNAKIQAGRAAFDTPDTLDTPADTGTRAPGGLTRP